MRSAGPDEFHRRVLLGLRRFLTGPRDGPRVVGVVWRPPGFTRAFIEPEFGFPPILGVDFDRPKQVEQVLAVLREVATKAYLPRVLPGAPADEFATLAVDATGYLSWSDAAARLSLDDCADAVVAAIGDPAWTGPAESGPDEPPAGSLGWLVGYVRTAPDRIRLYVERSDCTLGLDLRLAEAPDRQRAIRDRLREVAWGSPELAGDVALHGSVGPGDSYCDHVVDLTDRI